MKIIKIQKLSNNKYKIILDSKIITTFDTVILNYNLLYKKELTDAEIKKIELESNYFDAYDKVLNFATKKIRSEKEIKKYLDKFNITLEEKNKIVNKLREINVINDKVYCKAFINDKIHLSKYGINKIKKMLKEEEIDNKIIEEEIKNIDDRCIITNLENKIKKKILTNHKYSNYELKNKLLNYFINEGYSREDIVFYIEKYQKNDNDILEKEFSKLYYKYKNKEKDFIFKLKQKLIQKGFSREDINDLINKKTEE